MGYVTIKMDGDQVIDLLLDRLAYWTDDRKKIELYGKMYENLVEWGCFEGAELDVNLIVDNDFINWCQTVEDGDPDFDRLLELYDNDERDVSCEHLDCGASFIEAVSDDRDAILIRF